MMSIRSAIIQEAEKIANEQRSRGSTPPLITDELPLADSGLNSLSMAILVIRLEEMLGKNPFSDSDDVVYPLTFGEFVRLYEHAPA